MARGYTVADVFRTLLHSFITTHLHANDGIYEEQHSNQQTYIWQSLKVQKVVKKVVEDEQGQT